MLVRTLKPICRKWMTTLFLFSAMINLIFILIRILPTPNSPTDTKLQRTVSDESDKNKDSSAAATWLFETVSRRNQQVHSWPQESALLSWRDLKNQTLPSTCEGYFRDAVRERTVHRLTGTSDQVLEGDVQDTEQTNSGSDVCLVTQFTPGRLRMLTALLTRWQGPVSAVVYVREEELRDTKAQILDTVKEHGLITVHYVIAQGKYYPINYLRNVAMKMAVYDYVFMVDIDFVPSVNLYAKLLALARQDNHSESKVAWVVPTFEQKNLTDAPVDMTDLIQRWDANIVKPFHLAPLTKNAHGPTNFNKWRNANRQYQVKYVEGFEPYVLMRRRTAPAYIDLFLERYANKVSYFFDLHSKGFKFIVVPEVFVVHLPHASRDKKSLFRSLSTCTGYVFKKLKAKVRAAAATTATATVSTAAKPS